MFSLLKCLAAVLQQSPPKREISFTRSSVAEGNGTKLQYRSPLKVLVLLESHARQEKYILLAGGRMVYLEYSTLPNDLVDPVAFI